MRSPGKRNLIQYQGKQLICRVTWATSHLSCHLGNKSFVVSLGQQVICRITQLIHSWCYLGNKSFIRTPRQQFIQPVKWAIGLSACHLGKQLFIVSLGKQVIHRITWATSHLILFLGQHIVHHGIWEALLQVNINKLLCIVIVKTYLFIYGHGFVNHCNEI